MNTSLSFASCDDFSYRCVLCYMKRHFNPVRIVCVHFSQSIQRMNVDCAVERNRMVKLSVVSVRDQHTFAWDKRWMQCMCASVCEYRMAETISLHNEQQTYKTDGKIWVRWMMVHQMIEYHQWERDAMLKIVVNSFQFVSAWGRPV